MCAFIKLCLTFFAALFFLYGCSAMYQSPRSLPPDVVLPGPSVPEPAPTEPGQKHEPAPPVNAVSFLIARADSLKLSGELETAAASLERAVRIAPKNPIPWQRLAQIRLVQKDFAQAEALADKSNSLAKGLKPILLRNWQIIQEARELAGDMDGAFDAKRRIEALDVSN